MLDNGTAGPGRATTRDFPALTSLRAVAALLVFVYHFPPRGHGPIADVVISQGHVGVTVFFVLSGFLITLRYYRQFERREHRWADYFVRRVARILPLYYVVLTLTHVLSTGSVPLDASRLPEWTLTQALFDAAPEAVTVTTSWSLTVEECFYASAPLLFLAVAALRFRFGALAAVALVLVVSGAGLYLTGTAIQGIVTSIGVVGRGFLSDEVLLRSYTVFGRFPDFLIGAAAGFLFLTGRVEAAWNHRGGALLSSLLVTCGGLLLFAGQSGMVRDVADPMAWWRWNLLVAIASALSILALTCRQAPLSRLLSLRPATYLGRISYAMYLIQLTPLGTGLLFQLLPGRDGVSVLALYVGLNLVSALLFEAVEEPARETILALWRSRSWRALPLARSRAARGFAIAILLGVLGAQHTLWALGPRVPLDELEAVRVLGADSPDLLRGPVEAPTAHGRDPRVRLPESWRVGPVGDWRAPTAVLVFVDGNQIPFLGPRRPLDARAAAYYRRHRAEYVSLQVAAEPAVATLLNFTPAVAVTLAWSRFLDAPIPVLALLPVLAGVGFIWWRRRLWTPQSCLAVASAMAGSWLVSGAHLWPWAPILLAIELAALTGLALRRAPGEHQDPVALPAGV